MKRFACIWLPAFAIDRMRRVCPQRVPEAQPLALVESGPRGVGITAVNSPAAASGVHAGQMLADARAVLPALVTQAAEPRRDARALRQLALWLGRYGPQRDVDGMDGLWVDITGVAHLFGGEAALARDCVDRLGRAGLRALMAVADTRSGAFALARYATLAQPVAIAPPGEMRAALAGLPVEGLQLTGDLVLLLRRLGLKRIGQFYDLPREALARRFRSGAPKSTRGRKRARGLMRPVATYAGWAEALVMRLDQALGDLSEPARGIVEPPLYRVQQVYTEPLISHEGVMAALGDLARQLCAVLEAGDEGARALRFSLHRADGTVAEVMVRTSRPARAAGHITQLIEPRLERLDVGLGLDAIVLEALRTERLARTQAGFAGTDAGDGLADGLATGPPEGMGVLIDRLANRLGASAVFHLEERSSHIPERAGRRVAALHGVAPASGEPVSKPPRPAFLLAPAEPVTVLAEVPDGPPVRFTWRRVTRRVARAEGPERIAPEWWRLIGKEWAQEGRAGDGAGDAYGLGPRVEAPRPASRIRDYYRVEDEHGGVYWLYRAGIYPSGDPAAGSGPKDVKDNAGGEVAHASDPLESPTWYLQGVF